MKLHTAAEFWTPMQISHSGLFHTGCVQFCEGASKLDGAITHTHTPENSVKPAAKQQSLKLLACQTRQRATKALFGSRPPHKTLSRKALHCDACTWPLATLGISGWLPHGGCHDIILAKFRPLRLRFTILLMEIPAVTRISAFEKDAPLGNSKESVQSPAPSWRR